MPAKKFVALFTLTLFLMAALAAAMAHAQDYPARVIKIVVPFPAGGTADVMPRVIAEWLSRQWGQSVIVENHTGAGGNIGAEVVAKSDPDGYTLLASPPPPLVINQNLYPHLGFDPLQFVPIIVMARVPNALVVNPNKIAANTVKDFIAYAQANPGKITDATQGQRHYLAADFGNVPDDVTCEAAERAIPGLGAGAQRSRCRQRRLHVRQSWGITAARQSRQIETHRGRIAATHDGPA
jgi:tripartite-type tricarboxylate transporter receptor subunit TctC